MQLDVMQGAWVSDMLLDAGRRILSSYMANAADLKSAKALLDALGHAQ